MSKEPDHSKTSLEHENDDDVFDDENEETESDAKKKTPTFRTVLVLIMILLVYIGFNFLGAFVFMKIEKTPKEGTKHWFTEIKRDFLFNKTNCITEEELDRFLENVEDALDEGASPISKGNETIFYPYVWTLHNAFTLSFTIASTIGYGVVVPVTAGGQIFCIIFALFSIPFTGLLAAKMGSFVAYLIKKATVKSFGKFTKGKIITIIITFLFGLVLYFVIPTLLLLYVGNDEEWSFVECLYCIFITLSTIGFGDYVPNPSSSWGSIYVSIAVLVYIVAGLAWLATIINLIAMALKQQAAQLKQKVVKNQKHLRNFSSKVKSIRLKPLSHTKSRANKKKDKPSSTIPDGKTSGSGVKTEEGEVSLGHSGLYTVVLKNTHAIGEENTSK